MADLAPSVPRGSFGWFDRGCRVERSARTFMEHKRSRAMTRQGSGLPGCRGGACPLPRAPARGAPTKPTPSPCEPPGRASTRRPAWIFGLTAARGDGRFKTSARVSPPQALKDRPCEAQVASTPKPFLQRKSRCAPKDTAAKSCRVLLLPAIADAEEGLQRIDGDVVDVGISLQRQEHVPQSA